MGDLVPIPPATKSISRKVSHTLSRSDREYLKCYRDGGTHQEIGYRWAAMRNIEIKNDDTATSISFTKFSAIRAKLDKIGGPEAIWELLGLSMAQIAQTLVDGMNAMAVRPFVVRDQTVVQYTDPKGVIRHRVVTQERIEFSPPMVDQVTRNEAARTSAQLRGDIRRATGGVNVADDDKQAPIYIFNIGGNAQVQVNEK